MPFIQLYKIIRMSTHRFRLLFLLNDRISTGIKLLTLWAPVVFSAIALSTATKACSSTNEPHPHIPSTGQLVTVTKALGQLYSSTYATPRFMPRPSTVGTAIDPPITKRRYSSTYGTPVFTNRIRKPLWMSFYTLSQRLIITLLSHQLLRILTCGDKKDGAVVVPR
jgi:hypothetical protein